MLEMCRFIHVLDTKLKIVCATPRSAEWTEITKKSENFFGTMAIRARHGVGSSILEIACCDSILANSSSTLSYMESFLGVEQTVEHHLQLFAICFRKSFQAFD